VQCWDNALAESFFGAPKNELFHRTVFPTRATARQGHCRIDRSLLQSSPATFRARLQDTPTRSPKHTSQKAAKSA
jgi:transposase InsO family protein